MNSDIDNTGHLPGPVVFWQSLDKRTKFIRHCEGVYTLEHDGIDVMGPQSFERITTYFYAEFATDLSQFLSGEHL